jgi:hypothetical protein
MRIIVFILSILVFHPFEAEAETVFNDTQSFQIAKAVKLGRGKGNNDTTSASRRASRGGGKSDGSQNQYDSCASEFYLSNGACIKICDGTTCKAGFEKHPAGNKCYCY